MGIGSEILQTTLGTPCKPMTVTPWINVDEDYFIDGAPALTIESTLPCYYGGIITIVLEKTESTDSEGDNASEEDKDIKDQLPSEVQEKIDSFLPMHNPPIHNRLQRKRWRQVRQKSLPVKQEQR